MGNSERFVDVFRGDDEWLLTNASALLEMDRDGALVPHGIGGHARGIINALAARFERIVRDNDPSVDGGLGCKVMSYDHAHLEAVDLGYPSLTEALEALPATKAKHGGSDG